MAPKTLNLNVSGKTKSFSVYHKITQLVPRNELGEEADIIIFGPEANGVVPVYIASPKDLDHENIALRIRWFYDRRPKCVKCGAAHGNNHIKVAAFRNGTYYTEVVCDKCEPRVSTLAAVIRGDYVAPKVR